MSRILALLVVGASIAFTFFLLSFAAHHLSLIS